LFSQVAGLRRKLENKLLKRRNEVIKRVLKTLLKTPVKVLSGKHARLTIRGVGDEMEELIQTILHDGGRNTISNECTGKQTALQEGVILLKYRNHTLGELRKALVRWRV
jgi:hypothetical protein